MRSVGADNLWGKFVNLGFLGVIRVICQQLIGPSYSGSFFLRLADAISRTRIPEKLIKLCPIATNQAWSKRVAAMDILAKQSLDQDFTALEIGTWFGEGSTKIWGKYLKPGARLFLCDSWTKYASEVDIKKTPTYSSMDKLHHIAINSVLKKVYELEERTGGEVIVIRGKSAHVMASLKPETFDFVYVDGSHYYWDVFRDIELAKMLIKDGGCLCGDDLEADPCAEIETIAREHLDHDFITVRMSDGREISFHPGVALAVSQQIGAVNREQGFWWVWRQGNSWVCQRPLSQEQPCSFQPHTTAPAECVSDGRL